MRYVISIFTTLFICMLLVSCSATSVDTIPSRLGKSASWEEMLTSLSKPGPIRFTKHVAGNWQVPLSGLLNLDHPKAVAAGLIDMPESIKIFVYTLTHPEHGTFLVDSGLSTRFVDAANNDDISFMVKQAMNIRELEVKLTTAELVRRVGSIQGVFLTHIHMDHIMGISDLDDSVNVYVGPGESTLTSVLNAATQGTTDRLLGSNRTLREWQFGDSGLIDVFGDGSVWAIHSPGHTPGATAFLARTTQGIELMLGDVTHTKWGWENGVEPGTYSDDIPSSITSLNRLVSLVNESPAMGVHPGHQAL